LFATLAARHGAHKPRRQDAIIAQRGAR
jgi:hypothetical protein